MKRSLRVLSFGAGAIGTYIGGSLAMDGNDVVFLERPNVAEQLQIEGMHLNIGERTIKIPEPQIFSTIQDVLSDGPYDIALFALKSFDTKSALEILHPYGNDLPPILCLQNGVENEALIANRMGGNDMVIAGTVTSSIGKVKPGEIILERLRGVGIANTHSLSMILTDVMNAAGLNAHLYPRPDDMKINRSRKVYQQSRGCEQSGRVNR